MPVSNLKYLPKVDGIKAQIGGHPRGSHATDYQHFGLVLSYNTINIGISPGQYRFIVADKIESYIHQIEEQGTVDNDYVWDTAIKELMVNNLATFFLARLVVIAIRRIGTASLSELRQAQRNPTIFNTNHSIVIGKVGVYRVD